MTSHIPLQLPLSLPSWRGRIAQVRRWRWFAQNIGLHGRFFECLPRLGDKHRIMRVFERLQDSLARCEMLGAALCRPFVQKRLCGSERPVDYICGADLQGHANGLIKTLIHDAHSTNATQRGWARAVA